MKWTVLFSLLFVVPSIVSVVASGADSQPSVIRPDAGSRKDRMKGNDKLRSQAKKLAKKAKEASEDDDEEESASTDAASLDDTASSKKKKSGSKKGSDGDEEEDEDENSGSDDSATGSSKKARGEYYKRDPVLVIRTAKPLLEALKIGSSNYAAGRHERRGSGRKANSKEALKRGGPFKGKILSQLLLALADAYEKVFQKTADYLETPTEQSKKDKSSAKERTVLYESSTRKERINVVVAIEMNRQIQLVLPSIEERLSKSFTGQKYIKALAKSFGLKIRKDTEIEALAKAMFGLMTQCEFEHSEERIRKIKKKAKKDLIYVHEVPTIEPIYGILRSFVISVQAESYKGEAFNLLGKILLKEYKGVKKGVKKAKKSVSKAISTILKIVARKAEGDIGAKLTSALKVVDSKKSKSCSTYHIPSILKAITDMARADSFDEKSATAVHLAISQLIVEWVRVRKEYQFDDNPIGITVNIEPSPISVPDLRKNAHRKKDIDRALRKCFGKQSFSDKHRDMAKRVLLASSSGNAIRSAIVNLLVDPLIGDDIIAFLGDFVKNMPKMPRPRISYVQASVSALSILNQDYLKKSKHSKKKSKKSKKTKKSDTDSDADDGSSNSGSKESNSSDSSSSDSSGKSKSKKKSKKGKSKKSKASASSESDSSISDAIAVSKHSKAKASDPNYLVKRVFASLKKVWEFFGPQKLATSVQLGLLSGLDAYRKEWSHLKSRPSANRLERFIRGIRKNLKSKQVRSEIKSFLKKDPSDRSSKRFQAIARHIVPRGKKEKIFETEAVNKIASKVYRAIADEKSAKLKEQWRNIKKLTNLIINKTYAMEQGAMLKRLGKKDAKVLVMLSFVPKFNVAINYLKKFLLYDTRKGKSSRRDMPSK